MSIVQLAAPSISCGGCVRRVRLALEGQPGINSIEAKIGEATVEFDPGITSVEQIKGTMAAAGYPVAGASE